MSAALAIAVREIRERRFLLATAFVVGLLPVAASLWPAVAEQRNDELVAVLVGLAFPTAAALAVGASVVGRDLAEGRLGFYLARPISALSLWAGKFLGGYTLVALTFVLVVLPFNVATGTLRGWLDDKHAPSPLVLGPLALLLVMASAHVAASLYRSRSAWIALDLVLFVLAFAAIRQLMLRMAEAGAGEAIPAGAPYFLLGGALVPLAASAVQLAVGRADPARGRRALSGTFWSLAGLLLGLLFGLSSWVLATTPAETGGAPYGCDVAPRGGGLVFRGSNPGRAGYEPLFVMDGSTGAYARFSAERASRPVFTRDGRRAFWIARPPELFAIDRRPSLVVAHFDGGPPRLEELPLAGGEALYLLALDPEGRRALVYGRGFVAVVDALSGATTARLEATLVDAGEFLPDGRVRLLGRPGGLSAIVVRDWNPRSGDGVERARVPATARSVTLGLRGDQALLSPDGRELLLLDIAQGKQTTVTRGESRNSLLFGAARIGLADGGIAVGVGNGLWIVSPAGSVRKLIDLDPKDLIFGLAQPAADELAIGVLSPPRTRFVEIDSGRVRRDEKGLRPAGARQERLGDFPEPGSLGSRLFVTQDHALVELLPAGQRRVIVPAMQ